MQGQKQLAVAEPEPISTYVEHHTPSQHRVRDAAPELLAALKEMRNACAAAMRVMTDPDAFIAELDRAGVAHGFGVRAQAAIAKADPQD